jgi:hypothetical protein
VVFLILCLVIGVVAAVLFALASSTGVSVLDDFLLLDLVVLYAAWRLLLHPSTTAPLGSQCPAALSV